MVLEASSLQGQPGGVGFYILEVLRRWVDFAGDRAKFIVISQKPISLELPNGVVKVVEPNPVLARIKAAAWIRYFAGRLCPYADLYWSGGTLLPKNTGSARTLLTVHDLNYLIVPETMSTPQRIAHLLWAKADMLRANYILTNSQGTNVRIQSLTGRSADAVINPPVRETIRAMSLDERSKILAQLEIRGRYFLAVATQEPRKNLESLIKAFLSIKRKPAFEGYQLVLAGKSGWKSKFLSKLIENSESAGVRSLGYVSDDQLSALYSGCEAFVFPSLYEGFGMPAREAIKCGAKVIATATPEIQEAVWGDAVFIEGAERDIADALEKIATRSKPEQSEGRSFEIGRKEIERLHNAIFCRQGDF